MIELYYKGVSMKQKYLKTADFKGTIDSDLRVMRSHLSRSVISIILLLKSRVILLSDYSYHLMTAIFS